MKPKRLIKIVISLVMLAIVFRMAKVDQLKQVVANLNLFYVGLVVVGYLCGQLLSSTKWWLIARSGGIGVPFSAALRAYFIGMFVNCFGLGTLGGDFARAMMLVNGRPQKAEALASVIADRLHGLGVLAIIGTLSALILGIPALEHKLYNLPAILAAIAVGIIVFWFFGTSLVVRFLPGQSRFRQRVERVLAVFPKEPSTVAKITAISVVFHLLQIGLHRLMGEAVGVSLQWHHLLVFIPFVNIFSTLPISWNGLGVREVAYVFFLVPALLAPEQAVAFGAMWILAVTVSSAIGGILSVVTKGFSYEELTKESELAESQEPLVVKSSPNGV